MGEDIEETQLIAQLRYIIFVSLLHAWAELCISFFGIQRKLGLVQYFMFLFSHHSPICGFLIHNWSIRVHLKCKQSLPFSSSCMATLISMQIVYITSEVQIKCYVSIHNAATNASCSCCASPSHKSKFCLNFWLPETTSRLWKPWHWLLHSGSGKWKCVLCSTRWTGLSEVCS